MNHKLWNLPKKTQHLISICVSFLSMGIATALAFFYYFSVPENTANIALIYIMALILVSRFTTGYWYGAVCSFFAVICVNYLFTYPYFEINFTLTGYPITFLGMLAITLLTSTMTSHLSRQNMLIAEREKLLAESEKEKMRANLLRAISHDLRTPLTGIIGNSSLYLENSSHFTEEEKSELIKNIHNDSNWLLNMVENLLTVTRIKGDNFSITTTDEIVEEVIAESIQKLTKRYPGTEINAIVPENCLLIPMDAILIEQVLINLMENAVIHSSAHAPIELIVEDHPFHVSFVVRDYGKGIPQNQLKQLFDGTSQTLSQTADGRKGMGIGLSICKTIITAHQGTLHGYNHEAGAEFLFTLPKSQKTASEKGKS